MNFLVNMIAKATGLSAALWGAVDGKKTYILAGVAKLTALLGLMNELMPILNAHDTGALYAFVKALPHDQCWQMLIGGGITSCLRAAIAKATPDNTPAPTAPAAAPPAGN